MLSCYRIRVLGYRKRWMLCKIIQIVGSWKLIQINPKFWYLRKADAEQMSAGFTVMPRSSKQIPFRTWGSFSLREAQWPPRKRHSLNKLWKQLLTSRKKMSNFDYINPTELKDLFYKMVVPIGKTPVRIILWCPITKMLIKACFLVQPLEQEGLYQKCCISLCSKVFINHFYQMKASPECLNILTYCS